MEHLAPKKSLGQNFLTDRNIARKIVESLNPTADDLVIEIGPGQGAITGMLAESGARLVAIELDARMAARIRELHGDAVEVVERDVLQCDLTAMAREHGVGRARVIGNIPYYITSPILFHLIEHRASISDALLMMQREVADRLVARPRTKEYGILSVMAQTHAVPRLLFNVGPRCFYPPPKVTSAVVSLRFVDDDEAGQDIRDIERQHRLLVRTAFNQRRKTLRNSLTRLIAHNESGNELFRQAGVNPSARAEELTPDDYVRFARVLAEHGTDAGG